MTALEWPVDKPVFQNGLMKMYREKYSPPKDPEVSFEGKTVVITGCNTGLGLEAAVKYAVKGCSHLVLGVRTKEKGEATKNSILSRLPSFPADHISIQTVDYSSFASVTSFAHSVATAHPQIDILASNAGLVDPNFSLTADGNEKVVQVNYLSHILLAILLLPTLIATGKAKKTPSHVVFTGSMSHLDAENAHVPDTVPEKLSLREALQDKANFKPLFHYGLTKLLLQTAVQNLTSALDGVPGAPIMLTCCPAACKTGLWDSKGFYSYLINPMMTVCGRTPEEGSRTLVSAAALGEEARGGFWKNDKLNEESPKIRRELFEGIKKRDWEDLQVFLEGVEPETKSILDGLK
ncbi:hypothetical protein C1H76_4850 [Elsinoe australis]|uniref:Uncharacterized protein n=1 Tax=Elsinoe australis TaxID=40998 RepID=A0A4U7B231_9PEZI|nr:hypothetical protein C1H76_4850 [Elsinoe australis]